MRRHLPLVILFALVVLTASATAQRPGGRPAPPPPPPATLGPLVPLAPPTHFPVSPIITPPAGGLTIPFTPAASPPPRDLFRVGPFDRTYTRTRVPLFGYGGYAIGGGYPFGVPQVSPDYPPLPPEPPANGMLRLSVTPSTAQVFVDSYFAGTASDIEAQRVLMLPAGPHHVEIRAPEHESAAFDVRIAPGEMITYRSTLQSSTPPAPPRTAPATGPTKIYVIKDCYLGNIPPRPDRLPRGCDIKQVRVIS
jgi:hypothetical protein